MAYEELEAILGGFEGFELVNVTREPSTKPPRLLLELRAKEGHPKRCSKCGEVVLEIHETVERRVRDLDVGEWESWVVFPRARLQCPRCGPTVEEVPWLDRYQRMTKRLAEKIARLAQVLPIKHVADWFSLSWDTVKQIDKRALIERLQPLDLSEVKVIAIDEFAIHHGHRYATVITDPTTKRVLWVARDRDREAVRGFLDALGAKGCMRIEAVVMDMWRPYRTEIQSRCPNAVIVFDLFHMVAKYGREVVDRVRVDETNKISRAKGGCDLRTRAMRRVIKGTRWLLLKNPENLKNAAERVRLDELLAANHALFVVYVLKDDLKRLWGFRDPEVASRFWNEWYQRAMNSGIKPLMAFAEMLAAKIDSVIAHCTYPLSTGLLEGINNKIKVMKRMAYGFRDEEYFFLKIRAAFPGIPR
ncbi:MAG: ISL3 family transposase [Gemmatimonadaceae bacterium]